MLEHLTTLQWLVILAGTLLVGFVLRRLFGPTNLQRFARELEPLRKSERATWRRIVAIVNPHSGNKVGWCSPTPRRSPTLFALVVVACNLPKEDRSNTPSLLLPTSSLLSVSYSYADGYSHVAEHCGSPPRQ